MKFYLKTFILFVLSNIVKASDDCNCRTTWSPTQSPTKAPTKAPTKTPTQSPTKAPFVCNEDIDIGIVMDRSGSIFKGGLKKQKKFAIDFIDKFIINQTNTKFSVISFSSSVDDLVVLEDDYGKLVDSINSIPNPRGSTFTGDAIRHFNEIHRPKSQNDHLFMILITDGKPTKSIKGIKPIKYSIKMANMLLSNNNTYIVSIGIGDFDKHFLNDISSELYGKPLVYKLKSFSDLDGILDDLYSIVCYKN